MGCWILARPQEDGQIPVTGAGYLTAIYALADNNGLFLWGSGKKSPRLNQFACPWVPIGTLAAEVFVA
jgi:hypothetical protein